MLVDLAKGRSPSLGLADGEMTAEAVVDAPTEGAQGVVTHGLAQKEARGVAETESVGLAAEAAEDPLEHILRGSRYLCFSGAGVRGATYIGVFRALRESAAAACDDLLSVRLAGACGTSSGAFFALAVLVGVPLARLEQFAEERITAFAPFFDLTSLFASRYGLDDGKSLRDFVEHGLRILHLSVDVTLADLHRLTRREFACCATCVNTRRPVHFSHHTHPDLRVADALYMSMCVPIVFAPGELEARLYVDGCLTENLPVGYFPVDQTLHVYVRAGDAFASVRDWKDYAHSVCRCSLSLQHLQVEALARAHPGRFLGVEPVANCNGLSASLQQVRAFVNSGYAAVFARCHASAVEVVGCMAIRLASFVDSDPSPLSAFAREHDV